MNQYCRYCYYLNKNSNFGFVCYRLKKYIPAANIKNPNRCAYYCESINGDVITGNRYSKSLDEKHKNGQMAMF